MGGAVTAIEHGYQKGEIEDTAYKIAGEIDSKQRIVVGVNEFTDGAKASPPLMVIDGEIGRAQRERLAARKAARDQVKLQSALDAIESAASTDSNLLPLMKEAIIIGASVGEISDRLRKVWGVHRQHDPF
jgi:methylmalonyl-CoA mutase N-terminal domain/subunit